MQFNQLMEAAPSHSNNNQVSLDAGMSTNIMEDVHADNPACKVKTTEQSSTTKQSASKLKLNSN
jgi:hypothetical protein